MKMLYVFFIGLICISNPGMASDEYLFIIDNAYENNLSVFSGFPGSLWGKTSERIYLTGSHAAYDWMEAKITECQVIELKDQIDFLYLCKLSPKSRTDRADDILDMGKDYYLTSSAPGYGIKFRRLYRKPFITERQNVPGNILLEYNPAIDDLIGQVSQDSMIDLLNRVTGASPIFYNGHQDTIMTRFSFTEDYELAAGYLKEILESYGYFTEYHSFYGGLGHHVAVYDNNLAWAVGRQAEILKTTNGGTDWVSTSMGGWLGFWGVDNYGPNSIWVSGDWGTIYHSSNGGDTFTSQNSGTNNDLFGLDFVDAAEGWIAGESGLVLHTTNGGVNWSPQSTPSNEVLFDICFVDSDYGWAVGTGGEVLHTTNGGQTWVSQNSGATSGLLGVDFIDRNAGWLVGLDGTVRKTANGGADWQTVVLGENSFYYHVDFADSLHGSIVGWHGEIYYTTDGGATWNESITNSNGYFFGVDLGEDLTGYAFGMWALLKTTDGGQTWINQAANVNTAWRNVIATKTGTVYPDQHVILCAHLDDISESAYDMAPGADDNGSGTVTVVEAARIFSDYNFERTIKFCLWGGEEEGLLGSGAYAAEASARGDNIAGVLNFDMTAWDGNFDDSMDVVCGTDDPSRNLGTFYTTVLSDYNIQLLPEYLPIFDQGSDHAAFWEFGYPAIFMSENFEGDFNPYYHTTNDNVGHVNQTYLTNNARGAIGATATLAVLDTAFATVREDKQMPRETLLAYHYPNPFNASANIAFALWTEGLTDITVYDLQGRKAADIFEGYLKAGGHNVIWNAKNYPSGIYFYKVSSNGNSVYGKMTLLK